MGDRRRKTLSSSEQAYHYALNEGTIIILNILLGAFKMYNHTEQIRCDNTLIRIDVISEEKTDKVLEDMIFLNYRLAGVERSLSTEIDKPDIIWDKTKAKKQILFSNGQVLLDGEWFEGEIQRVLVSYIAMRMYKNDRYLFHSSAVNYKGKTVLFIGGESNSGKTMSQIEICRRGGKIVSTETLVTDFDGNVIMGSKNTFLRKRAKGTERIDKPNQDEGVKKFFDKEPKFELFEGKTGVDVVVLPDIDGNFATVVGEMAQSEKEYQTFHSLNDFLGLSILLSSGMPMPLFDDTELRNKRAKFISNFAKRRYIYIRGTGPKVIIDELEKLI
jgi:hypothetical protein